jgi:hypothetical protein
MEYIALALERDQSPLLRNARLKISEWLDFKNRRSHIIVTVYLEFSRSGKPQELDHIYIVIPENDFERIIFPTKDEIEEENEILKKIELSRKINIKSSFLPLIDVKNVYEFRQGEEHGLIRVDLRQFEIDDTNMKRFQFRFQVRDTFKKNPWSSTLFAPYWDWSYEAPIHPLVIDKKEFPEIVQIKMDFELWVMVERTMYDSVSDLNIRSTQPLDRFVILPDNISKEFGRDFVRPETLCIRWYFPEFSESGLGAEIIINKKKSAMEMEKKYIDRINSEPNHFFLTVSEILNSSRITCIDFNYIAERLRKEEFSKSLEILFQLLYRKDDHAFSKMGEFANILKGLQELKYGRYYFRLYRLLNQMRTREEVRDIFTPNIRKLLDEFLHEPESISKTIISLFKDLRNLVDLIEQYYYYNSPEDKYRQRKEIIEEIVRLREKAEHKLIDPEKDLIAKEILIKWEYLVEKDFERYFGTPKLSFELKTKKIFESERIHLIFDIKNISDVPLVHLIAKLLPSEQYDISEQEKRETIKRKRLTKSDDYNERIFSPEFVISPKVFQNIRVQLEVEALTEEEKKFIEVYDGEIGLFQEEIGFKKIERNPYIVGKPVKTEQMFFGREDIFGQIKGTIVGTSVNQTIIYGPYRIGKTSILYQLMNKLKGEYIPVLAIIHGLEAGDSELLRFWSEHISIAVRDIGKRVPEIPDYGETANPYREFQRFLDKIMEELREVKIIFMIDEYDLIDDLLENREISGGLFPLLDWMIKRDRVELIMAGRSPMTDLKVGKWKEVARPFAQIKLGPLEREDAIRLIKGPVEGYLDYDDSAVEKVLGLANCHPYLTQLCCHTLVNYHNRERRSVINYEDVENCIPDMVELGSPGLEAMVLASTTEEERIVLRVMGAALNEQTNISEQELVVRIREYNPDIEDKDIKSAIFRLIKKDVIRSMTEERRRFRFVCELFRYWIDVKMEPLRERTSA